MVNMKILYFKMRGKFYCLNYLIKDEHKSISLILKKEAWI